MACRWYGKQHDEFALTSTLQALLLETGEHVFKLAFATEPETTRNFLFGALVTSARDSSEAVGWVPPALPCISICYELCDAFPLLEGSAPYDRLRDKVAQILDAEVRLLPFTYFQRSIGQYAALHAIFAQSEYGAVFRDEPGSLVDLKMHVVLSCWARAPFACTLQPADLTASGAGGLPRGEWNTCFRSIASIFWYHAYVYEVIGESAEEGCSLSNVARTHDAVCGKGGGDVAGKLALLDILKLAYRYNYASL
jgi:hypothetical protein